ncbi:hypothetical protein LEP48_11780 [Isoptericola sp. NEAU-Y5]|uniref:Antitoxin n=1 Tax=Isoptericola luteus TaxID=2879484 RepID=A0ABS7ZI91_9MICO|nr:hypothetical protein [Isoptericola sp. NEAU-Y5]MCA5894021.1 hypothetical protein [Isoptericola sp. NEAU-Y5]
MARNTPESSGLDGLIAKAKALATDENLDKAADAIKKVAPDKVDRHVDSAAEQAKKYND